MMMSGNDDDDYHDDDDDHDYKNDENSMRTTLRWRYDDEMIRYIMLISLSYGDSNQMLI